jgi:hypothetical protein
VRKWHASAPDCRPYKSVEAQAVQGTRFVLHRCRQALRRSIKEKWLLSVVG